MAEQKTTSMSCKLFMCDNVISISGRYILRCNKLAYKSFFFFFFGGGQ